MLEKIDFVLTWVDGSDPAWLAKKNEYAGTQSASRVHEYRELQNLHYWFRGVEQFAPWVNKIHFVTWGHLPPWLNTKHPKLNIVNHKDYIPENYLPTFSANPIELNFHRIEGLQEQFVYFNDDTFIIRPMQKEDFFVNGLPCDQGGLDYISSQGRDIFPHLLINAIGITNKHFHKKLQMKKHRKKWYNKKYGLQNNLKTLLLSWTRNFSGINVAHLPNAFLKSTLERVWELEFRELDETSARKFRNFHDVNQYVFKFWQIASGGFNPVNVQKKGRSFMLFNHSQQLFNAIKNQTYAMICANDAESGDNFEQLRDELNSCFERILPEKSSFEI